MFEDTLTYQTGVFLNQPFAGLLADDLEADARRLYDRMASDIAVVATGVKGPAHAPAIAQTLPKALAAAPAATAACSRRLYRKLFPLVLGCTTHTLPGALPAK